MTALLTVLVGRLPIGWLQLVHNKARLAAALAGVAFASLLVLMQLGFLGALIASIRLPYAAMSADILRLLHKIKDSTSQSGGLSNEIKALLQNLRGEVLGMGRELGRQLDQANSTNRVAEDGS